MLCCPITCAPIQHLALLKGRFAFETEAILEWLGNHSLTNPYTNEPISVDWAYNILHGTDEPSLCMIRRAGVLAGGKVELIN